MRAFVCTPLHGARLTIAGCEAQVRRAREGHQPSAHGRAAPLLTPCASCAVGREHELGREPARWPNGSPIVRLTLSALGGAPMAPSPAPRAPSSTARAASKPAAPRKPVARKAPQRQRQRYTWGDRRLTLTDWASQPEALAAGVSASLLFDRVVRCGWSIERALTTRPRRGASLTSAEKERRRKERLAADPAAAARRKEQLRAADARRKGAA